VSEKDAGSQEPEFRRKKREYAREMPGFGNHDSEAGAGDKII